MESFMNIFFQYTFYLLPDCRYSNYEVTKRAVLCEQLPLGQFSSSGSQKKISFNYLLSASSK